MGVSDHGLRIMRKAYDFPNMKGRRNPYAKGLKKQVTLRLGVDVIDYFKALAEETGIPYQNLINLYLRECTRRRQETRPLLGLLSGSKQVRRCRNHSVKAARETNIGVVALLCGSFSVPAATYM